MATWKKVIVSGSDISQLSNDANYLVNAQLAATLTGSFTGSFGGDGSGLTNVPATGIVLSVLSGGDGIIPFDYSGSQNKTVTLDTGSSYFTDGVRGKISATDTSGASGIDLNYDSSTGTISGSLVNSTTLLGSTTITLGASASAVAGLTLTGATATGSFTGSFAGNFVGTTDLPDLVSGNGLTGGPYDGSLTKTFSVSASNNTLTVDANGVKVATSGVTSNELSASSVTTAKILDANVTNAKLANPTTLVGSTTLTLGATASSITGLTLVSTIGSGSFSGSFTGDGSGLSNLVSNLEVSGSTGNISIDLKTETLSILGTSNEITTTASGNSVTISLPSDVTIQQDLIVSRNLTVQGTASFQNTTNLDVADRFILMASGSNTAGDGGIVIQQGTQGIGESFGYDNAVTRWGVTGSFDGSQATFTPDAFMAAAVLGGVGVNDPSAVVARYVAKGNIFIGDNQDIYIYS
tara:strand:+ start:3227 stop:4624 length:1398 start_codon:yes stop_codon:yes gene_type:complete